MKDRSASSAGFSLIEVLISVTIMGIAMVAIIGALATQVRGAGLHRDQSNATTVLASAAERVQATTYRPCPAIGSAYTDAARTAILPSDWVTKGVAGSSAIDLSVKYWDGNSFQTACVVDATDTSGLMQLQLISLSVTGPGGDVERLDVVKQGP